MTQKTLLRNIYQTKRRDEGTLRFVLWRKTKMNYTYMVECADGTLYTGWTNCLEKRLYAHNFGSDGARYTRTKRPVKLVYCEGYRTKEEAMHREYEIKHLTREQKLRLQELLG